MRDDLHRLAGREHAVHAGGADADALLAAAHPQAVELRAVEQLAEDQRNLLLDDARAVVLHADLEAIGAGRFDVTQISGTMPASSQASSELSTASLTVVSRALRGLSKPSRCRFLAKNSLTEMSRCLAAIDSAVARRGARSAALESAC